MDAPINPKKHIRPKLSLVSALKRCEAMAAKGREAAKDCVAPAIDPVEEAARLHREKVACEKDAAAAIMGRSSIYAKCSMSDTVDNHPTKAFLFMRGLWLANSRENIILTGATGRGKTYALIAYAASTYSPNAVRFVRAYDLAEKLSRRDFDFTDRLKTVPCLIIDDLGAEPEGFRGSDFTAFLENLFDIRYEHKRQTLFSTNLVPMMIAKTYGERFVDRFKNSGQIKFLDDENWRTKTSD